MPLPQSLLRRLPLPSRLVVACFLVAVALGYGAALAQLHFQHAPAGQLLPGAADLERIYSGSTDKPVNTLERLLETVDGPLNGTGTMRPAFRERSEGWDSLVRDLSPDGMDRLIRSREGERLALLSWVRTGAKRDAYDKDDYPLGPDLDQQPIAEDFLVKDPATNQSASPKRVRLRTLVEKRCVTCHSATGREDRARLFPLDSYERLAPYCEVAVGGGPMSLPRLAQTTHAHLLSFAMLFGLTGFLVSLTRYPVWVRSVLAPWPLVIQCIEISFWWLARLEPFFAWAIGVTGLLVAVGLGLQIVCCLWDLFDRPGSRAD